MENFVEVMEFIDGFSKGGVPVKNLSRFRGLMDKLGNPQDNLQFIHVAGSNGKGSIIRFCSRMLINAGFCVGEYTSPYILEYSDRISVNGQNIPRHSIVKYAQQVREAIGENRDFSQFEITTAIAFLYYVNKQCDIVCLETGIGGMLDATNIIKSPLVSIIASISLEHTSILGDNVTDIARQKVGIIKKDRPVVLSSENDYEVVRVVLDTAVMQNSHVYFTKLSDAEVLESSIYGSKFVYKDMTFTTKMAGQHQIINAISAITAMFALRDQGYYITDENMMDGVASCEFFARSHVVSWKPLVVVDGAHNPMGMHYLGKLICDNIKNRPVVLLTGMLKDKNIQLSVDEIAPFVDEVVCVDFFYSTAYNAVELSKVFAEHNKNATVQGDISSAIKKTKELAGEDGAIIVGGSLYLASEFYRAIL